METNRILHTPPRSPQMENRQPFRSAPYALGIGLSVVLLLFELIAYLPIQYFAYQFFDSESISFYYSVQSFVLLGLWAFVMAIFLLHLRNFHLKQLSMVIIVYMVVTLVGYFIYPIYNSIDIEMGFIIRSIFSLVKLALGLYIAYQLVSYRNDYVGGLLYVGVVFGITMIVIFITSTISSYWMKIIHEDNHSMTMVSAVFSVTRIVSMFVAIISNALFIYLFYKGHEYGKSVANRSNQPVENTFL